MRVQTRTKNLVKRMHNGIYEEVLPELSLPGLKRKDNVTRHTIPQEES